MTERPETLPAQKTLTFEPAISPFDFNKAAVFKALEAANITQIVVSFDGYGDSGQIEDISARNSEEPVPMPERMIETVDITGPQSKPSLSGISLAAAVENPAYDVLARTHCGWENNDGAYGDIVFDVAVRTIALDYNERYTASKNFTHIL